MAESLRDLLQQTLGDTYVLERELVAGGMSRVFVATDRVLGRKVVVKVLPPDRAVDISIDRFRREIRVAAQLQHPNIVPLHSAADATSPLLYYIMPFVDGDSLRARVATGPRPVAEVVRILRDVACALSHAHERGVVHRDIKPENILLSGGIAVVTDFGIAKALSDAQVADAANPAATVPTGAGLAIGTARYMAPEQAAGAPDVDHRVDIYALGLVAYELLTGATPFAGRTPQATMAAHITETPPAIDAVIETVPAGLADLVMRCLSKDRDERPADAAEVVAAIDALGTPPQHRVSTARAPRSGGSSSKRWRVLAPIAAVLVIGLVVLGVATSARQADALPPDRVLVDAFENRTGEKSLDALGGAATDWITRGLTTSSVAEVLRTPDSSLSSPGHNPQAIARSVGAGTIIGGSYYRQGDSLYVDASLTDATTGAVRASVGPIAAPVARPLGAVDLLRQRVAGALAVMLGADSSVGPMPSQVMPRYDAYREFLLGTRAAERLDQREALKRHLRAVELDPDFHMAALEAAVAYQNMGNCAKTDSIVTAVLAQRERLTEWESNYAERTQAWCVGDWSTFYRTGQRAAQLAPRSTVAKFMAARSAYFVKRRIESVEGLKRIDPTRGAMRGNIQYHDDLIHTLHLIPDYREQLRYAQRARRQYPTRVHAIIYEIDAYAGLQRGEDVEKVLAIGVAMPPAPGDAETPGMLMQRAILELRVHGDSLRAARINERLLTWLRSQPRTGDRIPHDEQLLFALFTSGRFAEARAVLDTVTLGRPADALRRQVWLGRIAAATGDTVTARAAMDTIATYASRRFDRGNSYFHRSRIAALLGDHAEALRLLRESIARGGLFYVRSHLEPDFQTLRGLDEFEQLIYEQEM